MVAVDKDLKFVYVADSNNNRVQKFDINGKFIMSWGSKGSKDGQFIVPVSVVIDSNGDIIVNDRGNARVQKFDSNGKFITKWGSYGKGDGQFIDPEHLAIDSNGYVYVSDRGNNNIQVFKPVDNIHP